MILNDFILAVLHMSTTPKQGMLIQINGNSLKDIVCGIV